MKARTLRYLEYVTGRKGDAALDHFAKFLTDADGHPLSREAALHRIEGLAIQPNEALGDRQRRVA